MPSDAPSTATADPAVDAVPRAVGRALDLLEIVVDAGAINLSAAATAAGLTPTTALRYLRALETRGYVRRDDAGTFAAGRTVLHLGAAARHSGPVARLATAAQPVLDELTAATGESSYVAVSDGARAVYVATSESNPLDPPRRLGREVGARSRGLRSATRSSTPRVCTPAATASSPTSRRSPTRSRPTARSQQRSR